MIKFTVVITIFLAGIVLSSQAQNIQATYAIERNMNVNTPVGLKIITLNLTGHYYKKNNKYIYWETADYLAKYPTGVITFFAGNTVTMTLNKDTVQTLYYHDYDSLIMKMGLLNRAQEPIITYTFEADRSRPWVYQNETKTINGMKCQLATDRDQWRVWFCPDIPVKTSIESSQGLPGLIIEADCLPTHTHYKLLSYDAPANINDDIFNPAVKQPIINGGHLPNIKANREKTKLEKQQELLKQ
jgi:GLPGLI family protein